jgi:NADH-quinone oxidoreductase subunit L
LLAAIAAVVGSLAVVFSVDYMRGEAQLGRYYALVLFFIGAMAGLVLTGSLLCMFLFWEITAFCSYALISFHNDDPKAVAGGIKALIITQLGGIGLLAGALVVYAYLGSYQISTFLAEASTLPDDILSVIAFGCLAAAIAKSAQVPLHTWLPDAMEAPTPVTALIHAATMVNAGVYLLARFYPAFAPVPGWKTAVITIGLLSALLAAIMAITANDLKRALAYSTISQLGYMFYAVGVGAILASQFHLFSHALFKGLLFLAAGAVIHAVGTRDMRLMGGLGRQMPFVRLTFIIGALALAGLPITNGFFSKELVLEGGLAYGPLWAYIFMLVGAGLTALYTTRMVSMVFYGRAGSLQSESDAGRAMRVSLSLLALGTLVSWLLAGPISQVFAETLPYHQLSSVTTWEMVSEVLAAPATWLAMAVIGAGIAIWLLRDRLHIPARLWQPLTRLALDDFGFERLNQLLIRLVQQLSTATSYSQTGQLNWNVAGIVGGLVVVLTILVWGAL